MHMCELCMYGVMRKTSCVLRVYMNVNLPRCACKCMYVCMQVMNLIACIKRACAGLVSI